MTVAVTSNPSPEGAGGRGDGLLRTTRFGRFVFEMKDRGVASMQQFLREAHVEAREYAEARALNEPVTGVVVMKSRQKPVGEGWVAMRLDAFMDLVMRQ